MTLDQIRARLECIRGAHNDYEKAHSLEDGLRAEFIEHIASSGPSDLADMARAVLESDDFQFPRYCA